MPPVADVSLFLSRYGDLCGFVSLLPILMHVKFGSILRAQAALQKARESQTVEEQKVSAEKPADAAKEEKKGKAKAKASPTPAAQVPKGAAKATEKGTPKPAGVAVAGASADPMAPESAPPSWVFFMLLVAELCAAAQLLDARDPQVRRAAGEVLRVGQKGATSIAIALEAVEKLLANPDVYELARFAAICAGLLSMAVSVALGLNKEKELMGGAGRRLPSQVWKMASQVLSTVLSPRLLSSALLVALLVVGSWSAGGRFVRRSGVMDIIKSVAGLLRALALVGTASASQWEGPVPAWATMQAVAAAARGAQVYVHERVPWETLMKLGSGGAAADATRCALALEAWGFLALLPCVVSERKFRLLLPVMVLPVAAVVQPGAWSAMVEPYLQPAVQKMGFVFATSAMAVVFLGGLPTMASALALFQALVRMHGLDKLKV